MESSEMVVVAERYEEEEMSVVVVGGAASITNLDCGGSGAAVEERSLWLGPASSCWRAGATANASGAVVGGMIATLRVTDGGAGPICSTPEVMGSTRPNEDDDEEEEKEGSS